MPSGLGIPCTNAVSYTEVRRGVDDSIVTVGDAAEEVGTLRSGYSGEILGTEGVREGRQGRRVEWRRERARWTFGEEGEVRLEGILEGASSRTSYCWESVLVLVYSFCRYRGSGSAGGR